MQRTLAWEWLGNWTLQLEALRFLELLRDEVLKQRLRLALEVLRGNPFHASAINMAGGGERYRVRVSSYRIVYEAN